MDPCQARCSERAHTYGQVLGPLKSHHSLVHKVVVARPGLCSTVQKGSAQSSQTHRRRRSMLQRPSKTMGILEVLFSKTGQLHHSHHHQLGHTHSHSNIPLHTPLVRENSEDLGSSQDSGLLLATLALRQTLVRVNNQIPLQAVNKR